VGAGASRSPFISLPRSTCTFTRNPEKSLVSPTVWTDSLSAAPLSLYRSDRGKKKKNNQKTNKQKKPNNLNLTGKSGERERTELQEKKKRYKNK